MIDDVIVGRSEDAPAAAAALPKRRPRHLAGWLVGIAGALALGLLAGWQLGGRNPSTAEEEMRFPLALPPGWKLADADTTLFAISPDGRRRVVAAAHDDGRDGLLLGEIGRLRGANCPEPRAHARRSFHLTDGGSRYFGEGVLLRVAFDGGPPVPIVGNTGGQSRGAAWLADGSVVYSPDAATPLLRVSESGGQPQQSHHASQGDARPHASLAVPTARRARRSLYLGLHRHDGVLRRCHDRGRCGGHRRAENRAARIEPRRVSRSGRPDLCARRLALRHPVRSEVAGSEGVAGARPRACVDDRRQRRRALRSGGEWRAARGRRAMRQTSPEDGRCGSTAGEFKAPR